MNKIAAVAGACTVTAALALTGCSTKTESRTESSSASSAGTAATTSTSAAPAVKKTIADYVAENKIIETAIKRGDPGPPTFQFPMPPDWRPAGDQKPDWAYGAIIYDKPTDPADPPFMTAIISRLKGPGDTQVDEAKIFEYAPGLLQNLPGYQQDGEIKKTTFSGYDAIVFQGSYERDTQKRYIAQLTSVIPEKDGSVVVLQLNADAPNGQDGVIKDAAKVIEADTKIVN